MQTKILIIVGVSVASVLALFIMGFLLDKNAAKKEKAAAELLVMLAEKGISADEDEIKKAIAKKVNIQ